VRGARSEAHPSTDLARSQGQESVRLPSLHQLVWFSVGFSAITTRNGVWWGSGKRSRGGRGLGASVPRLLQPAEGLGVGAISMRAGARLPPPVIPHDGKPSSPARNLGRSRTRVTSGGTRRFTFTLRKRFAADRSETRTSFAPVSSLAAPWRPTSSASGCGRSTQVAETRECARGIRTADLGCS
jgi:hypothetical protein